MIWGEASWMLIFVIRFVSFIYLKSPSDSRCRHLHLTAARPCYYLTILGSDVVTVTVENSYYTQRFGIRLASLRRFNKLQADSVPLEGDTIVLRR